MVRAITPDISFLNAALKRRTIAGAVALVADRSADVLWQHACGCSDAATSLPMRTDALFWAASGLSKPLTAAAAMLLVDGGELALDDPVSKFVRELDGAPVGAATVRHALSHTSGLPFASDAELGDAARFDGSAFKRYRDTGDDAVYDAVGLRDAAASYTMPLRSAPGASFYYSNAGINLVGRIIEVVSGEEYADFVDRRLLEPLGMRDTTLWPSTAQLERLAAGHSGDGSLRRVPFPQLTRPYSDRGRAPSPSGGYFSTAADCARFGRMVLRGGELDGRRYLSEGAVAQMTTEQTPGYALGWAVAAGGAWDEDGGGGFGHGGAMGTKLFLHPGAGRVAVLMCHQDGGFDTDGVAFGEHWWYRQRSALLFAES